MKELSPNINAVVLDIDRSMKGHQSFSHVGYLKIMALRTSIQSALLQNKIEIYSFECDSVFFQNPIPVLRNYSGIYDIIFISNYQLKNTINGGFLYLFPTLPTIQTFKELNRMMQALYQKIKDIPSQKFVKDSENDQTYLSKLNNERYAGLKSVTIRFRFFPDGKWYDISEGERRQTNPILIHNNWIVGNQAKINRSKMWGHWFLKKDRTCNLNYIKRFFFKKTKINIFERTSRETKINIKSDDTD